jgi:hypothetical protein
MSVFLLTPEGREHIVELQSEIGLRRKRPPGAFPQVPRLLRFMARSSRGFKLMTDEDPIGDIRGNSGLARCADSDRTSSEVREPPF